jgi:LysR family nitrogen assimilation transcriptional regulator
VGILQLVSQAREELGAQRDEPTGHITIGLPPSIARQLTLPLIDGFRRQLPKARLSIVEGLSTHVVEWIVTGRVDVGLLHNPEAQPSLEILPVLEEPLCLVEALAQRPTGSRVATPTSKASAAGSLPLRELSRYPLVMPERNQAIRKLLESQAALAGVKLDIAWEVSSIPAIIDLVCAGYGHGVLTASAVAASARADELRVRVLTQPELISVLCVAVSAHKRSTPLTRHARSLLQSLVGALPQGVHTLR